MALFAEAYESKQLGLVGLASLFQLVLRRTIKGTQLVQVSPPNRNLFRGCHPKEDTGVRCRATALPQDGY